MTTITVDLSDDSLAAVQAAVADGAFGSMSAVLNAAVAAWQADQVLAGLDVEAVRAAVAEGRASGPTIPADEVFERILGRLDLMAKGA